MSYESRNEEIVGQSKSSILPRIRNDKSRNLDYVDSSQGSSQLYTLNNKYRYVSESPAKEASPEHKLQK